MYRNKRINFLVSYCHFYQEKKIVPFPESTLEWVGLKEGQSYEFWVSCTTHVGEGTPTPRTKITTTSNNKGMNTTKVFINTYNA